MKHFVIAYCRDNDDVIIKFTQAPSQVHALMQVMDSGYFDPTLFDDNDGKPDFDIDANAIIESCMDYSDTRVTVAVVPTLHETTP